jgi:parallel beta-helix repeat protein
MRRLDLPGEVVTVRAASQGESTMKLSACILLTLALTARAGTVLVANNGTDSLTCGVPGNPCRSISRAIQNAGAGDTISVGPGVYGDVNFSGTFDNPGDETGPLGTCNCLVDVNKPVRIISRSGADVTVIDAGYLPLTPVLIEAGGVTFGAPKHGFTVTGGGGAAGVRISAANGVTVAAIRSVGNARGFQVTTGSTNNTFTGNVAHLNDAEGFRLAGVGDAVLGNVASANGDAGILSLENDIRIANNVLVDNGTDGIQLGAGTIGAVIDRNSTLNNTRFGILLNTGAAATITRNNVFGNNDAGGQYGGLSMLNCGLGNDTGGALTIDANFFGATSGPGVSPADSICDFHSSTTTSQGVANKEIKVKPTAP